jgi:hypothetical protein
MLGGQEAIMLESSKAIEFYKVADFQASQLSSIPASRPF